MLLNDLLNIKGIDPQQVLVLRHRSHEVKLQRVLLAYARNAVPRAPVNARRKSGQPALG
jgi:hypothetical protein